MPYQVEAMKGARSDAHELQIKLLYPKLKLIDYIKIFILISISLILNSCSTKHKLKYDLESAEASIWAAENSQKYVGHYKVGSTYKIGQKTYVPIIEKKYDEIGIASWYGIPGGFHGSKTANGDVFNKESLTAAHPTLPMPSLVRVINLENNHSLILMVNDRGPFAHNRIIDVSEKAAKILGFKNKGTAKVRVIYLPDETSNLLSKLTLPKVNGKIASTNMKNAKCNVVCHLHEINRIEYKQELVNNKIKSKIKHDLYIEAGGFRSINDAQNFIIKMNLRIKNSVVRKGKLYYVSLGPLLNKKAFDIISKKALNIKIKNIDKIKIRAVKKI